MATILIPTPLRQFASGLDTVEVSAATVGEALSRLVAEHPQIKRNLYTDQGRLRSFVNVYVDDEDIRYLDREDTALEPDEHDQHRPVDRGRRDRNRDGNRRNTASAPPVEPGDPAVQQAPDSAGSRSGGPEES